MCHWSASACQEFYTSQNSFDGILWHHCKNIIALNLTFFQKCNRFEWGKQKWKREQIVDKKWVDFIENHHTNVLRLKCTWSVHSSWIDFHKVSYSTYNLLTVLSSLHGYPYFLRGILSILFIPSVSWFIYPYSPRVIWYPCGRGPEIICEI